MAVLLKLITLVVIATKPSLPVFLGFLQLLSSSGAYPAKIRAGAEISAGCCVEPLERVLPNFTPRVTFTSQALFSLTSGF